MSDFDDSLKGNQMPPNARAKVLARVYAAILSWPDKQEKQTEKPANADENTPICPDEGPITGG